jgi:hypothetical protein
MASTVHHRSAFRHTIPTDAVQRMADHIAGYGLEVSSFVATPILGAARAVLGHGLAGGSQKFLTQCCKACAIGSRMREIGIRPSGGNSH